MSQPRGRAYFYKMTCDNGGAPCVADGLLSLAICKPALRKTAKPGDLVVGFTAQSLNPHHLLVYLARVTEKLPSGRYYQDAQYRNRPDCVYEFVDVPGHGRQLRYRAGKLYHSANDLAHDCGRPPAYERALVLLSDDFRYFGCTASDEYKRRFPIIADAVGKLGRGHRVNHSPELHEALWALWEEERANMQAEMPNPLLKAPNPVIAELGRGGPGIGSGGSSHSGRLDEGVKIGCVDGQAASRRALSVRCG